MKKKFLSLMMAAAVVATTSVSAFAADKTTNLTVGENGVEQKVNITGNIADTKGQVVEGTITVTVPTAMAFTINSAGELENGKITISNKSDSNLKVIAKGFVDSTPTSGIVVKKNDGLETIVSDYEAGKRNITLTLTGDKRIGLFSTGTATGTGLYNVDSRAEITEEDDALLGVILANDELELRLDGETEKKNDGSYKAPNNPIKDDFTLKLKIKKEI